jgi:hypothetical protein
MEDKMKRQLLALAVILMFAPLILSLQTTTVVNPTTLQCSPSADHSRLGLDDQPLVTRYEMRIFLESSNVNLIKTVDLGKPTPVSDLITITTTQTPTLFSGLNLNTKYLARVVAIGPSGEGVSDFSNPFGFSGPPAAPGGNPTIKK